MFVLYGYETTSSGGITTLALSPDEHWLVAGGFDVAAHLWDMTDSGARSSPLKLTNAFPAPALSPDGHWLAAGSLDGTTRLWDLTVRNPATQPQLLHGHTRSVWAVAISPDGHWLATGGADGEARLWDLTAGDPSAGSIALRGHNDAILSIVIGPDNHWLITGSADKTARLWDLTAKNPAATASIPLRGHTSDILGVTISSDSRWLITSARDDTTSPNGTVRIWPLRLEDIVKLACRAAGRNLTWTDWKQYFAGQEYHKTCAYQAVPPSVIAATLDQARSARTADRPQDAETAYVRAAEWAIEANSRWMTVAGCRQGSLGGFAQVVIAACDRAVVLSPEGVDALAGRGMARALTGDRAGAIADLALYVQRAKEFGGKAEDIRKRETWLTALKAGQNPFDAATLAALLKEDQLPATYK